MNNFSMTALVSAFSRAWHAENNEVRIFNDSVARKLLSDEEYRGIADNMSGGIGYFAPNFSGSREEALRFAVERVLAPAPLARSAFAESALENAAVIGAKQYLILAAGYDTFAYRQSDFAKNMSIFEVDRAEMLADKCRRAKAAELSEADNVVHVGTDLSDSGWANALAKSGFSVEKVSFCSLLGIVYYLTNGQFAELISLLSRLVPNNSSVVFDYPTTEYFTPRHNVKADCRRELAQGAGESMPCRGYTYRDMETLLEENGFLIYEHMTPEQATTRFFSDYNSAYPQHPMAAAENVNYCLAVKHR